MYGVSQRLTAVTIEGDQCHTPVTTKQYLCEHIKKGTGQLDDISMQEVLVDYPDCIQEIQSHM